MGVKHVRKDITGQRFGKLVALRFVRHKTSGSNNQSKWLCRCDCGTEKAIFRGALLSGKSTSCGCAVRTANGDAGRDHKAPEYEIWLGMRKRCENKNSKSWPHYGGRGIKVYEPWRSSYRTFLIDVGRRPSSKHSLDRINNDGDYVPGNVRWATAKEQIANRRPVPKRSWLSAAKHAYNVVSDFESVIANYSGAPYAVALESCTNALLLACSYLKVKEVRIPKFTYCGVPMSVMHAGGKVKFTDEAWTGMYQLKPYPIYDCARIFTSKMYKPSTFMCLSFHWSKHLPIGRGGAILCDDEKAAEWFRRAVFDGRKRGLSPDQDAFRFAGWHLYMTPPLAAQGLMLMASIPEHNKPLPNSDYPDLSDPKHKAFQ